MESRKVEWTHGIRLTSIAVAAAIFVPGSVDGEESREGVQQLSSRMVVKLAESKFAGGPARRRSTEGNGGSKSKFAGGPPRDRIAVGREKEGQQGEGPDATVEISDGDSGGGSQPEKVVGSSGTDRTSGNGGAKSGAKEKKNKVKKKPDHSKSPVIQSEARKSVKQRDAGKKVEDERGKRRKEVESGLKGAFEKKKIAEDDLPETPIKIELGDMDESVPDMGSSDNLGE